MATYIQVDIWGGDLHQRLVRSYEETDWKRVAEIVECEVEAGMLVNILHTDFKCPPEKVEEQTNKLKGLL